MADEKTAGAEREIADILKPHFEVTGNQATRRPVMQSVPETPETPPEDHKAPLPLRTVSERLAELQEQLGMIESKIDLMIAVLR